MKRFAVLAAALALIVYAAPQAFAQEIASVTTETVTIEVVPGDFQPKEPGTAAFLSALWPGLGQRYNGQYAKGTRFALAEGAALVLTLYAVQNPVESSTEMYGIRVPEVKTNSLVYVGYAAMVGIYIYSIADAATTAERLNREHGVTVGLVPNVEPNGQVRGLRVAFHLRL